MFLQTHLCVGPCGCDSVAVAGPESRAWADELQEIRPSLFGLFDIEPSRFDCYVVMPSDIFETAYPIYGPRE